MERVLQRGIESGERRLPRATRDLQLLRRLAVERVGVAQERRVPLAAHVLEDTVDYFIRAQVGAKHAADALPHAWREIGLLETASPGQLVSGLVQIPDEAGHRRR